MLQNLHLHLKNIVPDSTPTTSYATGSPSPAARKLMAEKGVELTHGSGKAGRITKEDVLLAKTAMGKGTWSSWFRA